MREPADIPGIPLTVIGGFLGAGKTTLLNRVLSGNSGVRYAVMVNDFGDLAIDDSLITGHSGETLSFANGCVCCTLGDNFLASIDQLLERPMPPEQILVEASGVADPRAIADMAVLHPGLKRDLILVMTDAASIRQRAMDERLSDTVDRQLAAADLLILNKCDLIDDDTRAEVRQWLGEQTPAPIVESRHADLPLALLAAQALEPQQDPVHRSHEADHSDIFAARTLPMADAVDLDRLRQTLSELPPSVLRVKGFVLAGNNRYLVQWSGGQGDIDEVGGDDHPLALVLIGTADMPGEKSLRQLFADARPIGG